MNLLHVPNTMVSLKIANVNSRFTANTENSSKSKVWMSLEPYMFAYNTSSVIVIVVQRTYASDDCC